MSLYQLLYHRRAPQNRVFEFWVFSFYRSIIVVEPETIDTNGFEVKWSEKKKFHSTESKEANGVYFTAPNGELLAVQFDDVSEAKDHQELTLPNGETVAIDVVKGKVKVHRSRVTRKTG